MKESGWELFKKGKTVSGIDFNDSVSLEHYSDIFEEVKSERATAQFGLDREIYITKLPRFVVVIKTPEEEHLARVEEQKKGIVATWGRYEGNQSK